MDVNFNSRSLFILEYLARDTDLKKQNGKTLFTDSKSSGSQTTLHCWRGAHQEAVAVCGAHGRPRQFRHHLGDGEAVVLADVVEKPHGVVLHHHVFRGESLLYLIHPALHYVPTAPGAEVLGGGGGGGGGGIHQTWLTISRE